MKKQRVMKLADSLGCTLEISHGEITCMAPPGHHFSGYGFHESIANANYSYRAEQWEQIYEDLAGGFEPCEQDSCGAWLDGRCDWWADDDDVFTTVGAQKEVTP